MKTKICKKCGSEFISKRCGACVKAYNKFYYANNLEKERARVKIRHAINPEKERSRRKKFRLSHPDQDKNYKQINRERLRPIWRASTIKWRNSNPEKVRTAKKLWCQNNPEARRFYKQKRRARKSSSGGNLSKGLIKKLFALQKGKCACCRQPLGDDYHLDHIMPLALGGTNTDDNVQLLRSKCNLQKSARHPIEFMQSRGFLL